LSNKYDKNILSNVVACIQKDDKLISPSSAEIKVASPSDMDLDMDMDMEMEDNNMESDLTATSPYERANDNIKCIYSGLTLDEKSDLPYLEKGQSISDNIFNLLVVDDIKLVSTISITYNVS
jgi:hypothetical protein